MSCPTFLHLGRKVGAGVVAEIFIALKDEQGFTHQEGYGT